MLLLWRAGEPPRGQAPRRGVRRSGSSACSVTCVFSARIAPTFAVSSAVGHGMFAPVSVVIVSAVVRYANYSMGDVAEWAAR